MKIAVMGLGYWGPNLVRNFLGNSGVTEVIACDIDSNRLKFIKSKFPPVTTTSDTESVFKSDCDAIAIATPVFKHHELAKQALLAGKHVWVEKPFTSTSREAEDLINIAEQNKLIIFVDHTFLYTGAVKKMKELVESNELGDIMYFDSERINLGLFQHDVNVIWDLAPHDLSIMNYLIPDKKITAVSAIGVANFNYYQENIAQISLMFEDESIFAHFHVNWISPVKIRRMIVGGTKKMLVFNDMENSEKIKVYDCGVVMNTKEMVHTALVQYRIGDMHSPKLLQTEALALGVQEFIESILEDRQPLTNARDGYEVVRILEAAETSIKHRGQLIELTSLGKLTDGDKIQKYIRDRKIAHLG